MSEYKDELSKAMLMLAEDERTVFLGQAVACPGTYMSATFDDIPDAKKIEMPVAEELQLGVSIGMALDGRVPVSVYPRWNFLLLAANQLVNHLDVMKPHVIVRVGVGSEKPLDPGPQHKGDFSMPFRGMLRNTAVIQLHDAKDIVPEYQRALGRKGPSIMVEYADNY